MNALQADRDPAPAHPYSAQELRIPEIEDEAIYIGGSRHGQRVMLGIDTHYITTRTEVWDKHTRSWPVAKTKVMQFLVLRGMEPAGRERLIAEQTK